MASKAEMDVMYLTCYTKLLDELRVKQAERPADCAVLAEVTRNYRDWIVLVTGLKDIPEVPSK